MSQKDPNETDDRTLILADVARKAQVQVREFVTQLLRRQLADPRAAEVATALSDGRRTHDFPIDADLARSFDLKVSTDPPDEVRYLMGLYPSRVTGGPRSRTSQCPTNPLSDGNQPVAFAGRRGGVERHGRLITRLPCARWTCSARS